MRVLVLGSAVGVAALAAGITTALHGTPATLSPLSAVTGALARTSAHSYTFRLDTTVRTQIREVSADLVTGAYDPGRRLGRELLTARAAGQTKRAQIRFLGSYLYTSVSPRSGFARPWDESPLAAVTTAGMPPADLYGFASDQPVSPAELNVVLRSAGTAVHDSGPVSGPGWTGIRYTFTASLYHGRESVSGNVYVDQQGQVRRITTVTEEGVQAGGKPFLTTDRAINFGEFGAPVRASAPPAGQLKETSGEPYWGFYF